MFYNWNIFNISLLTNFNNDLAVTAISGPNNIPYGQGGSWSFTVANPGSLSQDFFEVSFRDIKNCFLPSYLQVNELLLPGQSMDLNFVINYPGQMNTVVYARVELPNDDFPDNNNSSKLFLRVEPEMEFDILVWDNDNSVATIIDPEYGDFVGAEAGIIGALSDAGIDFDLSLVLPDDLIEYDMILCTMGPWCRS